MKKFLHVCMTPALIDQFDVSRSVVVVIDVLRATTSMCVAFGHGARMIVPVETEAECIAFKPEGYLTACERNGEQQEGFDFGNSPFSFMGPEIAGAKIAISTTNGTRAMKAAQQRGAKEIVVGSFSNISTLCDWLLAQEHHICLLCSGWKEHITIEDTIFAGAVAQRLWDHIRPYQDTAIMAKALYRTAVTRKMYFIRHSSHRARLLHLNLQRDVKFCMRRDTHNVLPLLVGNTLFDFNGVADFDAYKSQCLAEETPWPVPLSQS